MLMCSFLSFQKLSYAAVALLSHQARTPTPVDHFPKEKQINSSTTTTPRPPRRHSRQSDFSPATLQDTDSDVDVDWNASKQRRGRSRAKGLAKKRVARAGF